MTDENEMSELGVVRLLEDLGPIQLVSLLEEEGKDLDGASRSAHKRGYDKPGYVLDDDDLLHLWSYVMRLASLAAKASHLVSKKTLSTFLSMVDSNEISLDMIETFRAAVSEEDGVEYSVGEVLTFVHIAVRDIMAFERFVQAVHGSQDEVMAMREAAKVRYSV